MNRKQRRSAKYVPGISNTKRGPGRIHVQGPRPKLVPDAKPTTLTQEIIERQQEAAPRSYIDYEGRVIADFASVKAAEAAIEQINEHDPVTVAAGEYGIGANEAADREYQQEEN